MMNSILVFLFFCFFFHSKCIWIYLFYFSIFHGGMVRMGTHKQNIHNDTLANETEMIS